MCVDGQSESRSRGTTRHSGQYVGLCVPAHRRPSAGPVSLVAPGGTNPLGCLRDSLRRSQSVTMPEPANGPPAGDDAGKAAGITEVRRQEALLKTGALQNAILTSANFSIIATDEKGIIQLFNVGAERMLGYRGRRGREQDQPQRHPRSAGSDGARAGAEPRTRHHRSRRASRRWRSRPRAASRTSTS